MLAAMALAMIHRRLTPTQNRCHTTNHQSTTTMVAMAHTAQAAHMVQVM